MSASPPVSTPPRVHTCPSCKGVILYLDGEACPGLVYRHGTLLTNTNETTRGEPVACERCFSWKNRVESAKKIREQDRQRAEEWEAKQKMETLPAPPVDERSVKQILKEDGESVVALFGEVVEVVDRGRSLFRKFFPKD